MAARIIGHESHRTSSARYFNNMVETQAGRDAFEDSQLLSRADRGVADDSSTVSPTVPLHLSRVTKFCMLLFLLLEMSNAVLTVPLLSLLERRICNDY
jgi:hypothetical protein